MSFILRRLLHLGGEGEEGPEIPGGLGPENKVSALETHIASWLGLSPHPRLPYTQYSICDLPGKKALGFQGTGADAQKHWRSETSCNITFALGQVGDLTFPIQLLFLVTHSDKANPKSHDV